MYIAKLIVTILMLFLAFAACAGQDALLNRLQADHQALSAAQRDYQRQREQGTLGAVEAADYAGYLARLRERVSRDCLMLARADIRPPEELPCPASLPSAAKPAPIDQRSEQTRAERTATMDAELNAGLGEFDEMLLREQERVKAAAPRSDAGGGSGAGSGQGEGDSGDEGSQMGDAGESGDLTGSAGRPVSGGADDQPPSGAAGGGGTQTGAREQPADIPDGSDDDLVARQMREAAEKETNPGLKKKLWEEYRKYKKGTR